MSIKEGDFSVVFFDLDGTLLPMELDDFMSTYFSRIAAYMAAHGLDPELFMHALKAGTAKMQSHSLDQTNEEAFWGEFFDVYGVAADDVAERARMREIADAFYEEDFGHVGDGVVANPAAGRVVRKLADKGYRLALTTMPMFPRRAVEHRLAWAGVDPELFERITTYENSHSVKPKTDYYAENLEALGVEGDEVLMIGNNTLEDMSILELGANGYLVTDFLLDPIGFDMDSVRCGTMDDLEAWVDSI